MTRFTAASEYLKSASDEDLLHTLPGLGRYVVGDFTTADGTSLLVEYCDDRVLDDGGKELLHVLRTSFPAHEYVLLRTPATTDLALPWRRDLTYLRHQGRIPTAVPLNVRRAQPHEDGMIREWLIQALKNGAHDRGEQISTASLDAAVEEIMSTSGRESWVYTAEGAPVGHATLQTEAHDTVAASSYVELEDILIEPPYQKQAMGDLVAVSAYRSVQLGLPLLGNLVHVASDPAASDRVLAKLEGQGWRPDHCIWRCGLTAV
jgi:hypothetical protein